MAVLLAHQAVTHPNTIVGDAIDIPPTVKTARIECYHGFNEAAANTNGGVFWIQTSLSASGNDDWITQGTPFTSTTGTPADEAFAATEPAGETTIAVSGVGSTTGFAAGDLVYVRDATVASSEWAYVQEIVTDTSIILVDGLTNAHALTTTTIFGSAEKFTTKLDVIGVKRIRAVYLHEGATAANSHIKAELVFNENG